MITVTATDIQNNFGKYLQMVQKGEEIVILRNGVETARMISRDKCASFLTDSLAGVLKSDYDEKQMRAERARRYESAD